MSIVNVLPVVLHMFWQLYMVKWFITVVPKLVRAITEIKVAIIT